MLSSSLYFFLPFNLVYVKFNTLPRYCCFCDLYLQKKDIINSSLMHLSVENSGAGIAQHPWYCLTLPSAKYRYTSFDVVSYKYSYFNFFPTVIPFNFSCSCHLCVWISLYGQTAFSQHLTSSLVDLKGQITIYFPLKLSVKPTDPVMRKSVDIVGICG